MSPDETGVRFTNKLIKDHPLRRVYNSGYVCGGIAIGDVNGDQRPDIYCVSGPLENRLYVQTDTLKFKDVTEAAGVSGGDNWGAGAAFKDIDNDGDVDLYVCNYESPNQLFLNDGHGHFTEAAESHGLAIVNSSMMPAFCDYDLDGDLDLYLLTNRVFRKGGRPKEPPFEMVDGKPQVKPEFARFYALTKQANDKYQMHDYGQPDLLLQNQGDGTFKDVTSDSGIIGDGYGLSATWWDYNHDGKPDIYVANDYDSPDCLYRNDGNGKFTNVLKETLPHTSWFSMGADFGDLNNDGLFDFLVVDMAATTHFAQKTTMGAMSAAKLAKVAGPPPQIMRNALYVNSGTARFQEAAYLAGLANSDWSWSVKIADFDNDGLQDVFITNGMARNINNSDIIVTDDMRIGHEEFDFYADTPTRPEQNLAFRNEGNLNFRDVSKEWNLAHVGMSYASATADLDGDGDLDLVVANLDEPVSIYRNDINSAQSSANRLVVRLHGKNGNSQGIGSTVKLKSTSGEQIRQLIPTTGFLGDSEPIAHFGLAADDKVDSLEISWPSGRVQTVSNVKLNHRIDIAEPTEDLDAEKHRAEMHSKMFAGGPISIRHQDDYFDDFQLQPLLPNQLSQFGPDLKFGDVNGDGLEDFYMTGSAGYAGQLFVRDSDGSFRLSAQAAFEIDAAAEDLGCHFFDADGDGDLDLYVASGSVENHDHPALYQDRLYVNDDNGSFVRSEKALPELTDSTEDVSSHDFDHDGDLDLFVGGRLLPGQYPLSPKSRLLRNDDGKFTDVTESIAPELLSAGMVTASCWADVNGDGWADLMLTTEWGPVRYFENDNGKLVEQTNHAGLSDQTGWWNDIVPADLDGDGDTDFVVANFGLVTKYHASIDHPALLYYGDFAQNGKMKLVEAEHENETLFPIRGKSCSTNAMPHLANKFTTYRDFALASLGDIYSDKCLNEAHRFAATELQSGILFNDNGQFTFQPLPRIAQISPSLAAAVADFNQDGHIDIFLGQNFFVPQVETGRMDSGLGQLLLNDGQRRFRAVRPDESGLTIPDDVRAVSVVDLNADGRPDLVIATNNGPISTWINQPPAK
ncbi:MAG: VCBS repeat-containing protein [Planctomycetales bacterium]|nr:VCBS repeat-containing protein [Planctomycetales bacterium]